MAADLDGAAVVRPWTELAGATYPTVVDGDNVLGRLLNYRIVPNGLFVDEDGVLQGKWIRFYHDDSECVAAVDQFRAGTLAPFEREPEARLPGAGGLTPVERELYETRVRLGTALAALGRRAEAADEWYRAVLMDPENFVLRKQVWRLRYPERFGQTIDFEWQKEQLVREQAEEETMRQAGCGPDGCLLPQYMQS